MNILAGPVKCQRGIDDGATDNVFAQKEIDASCPIIDVKRLIISENMKKKEKRGVGPMWLSTLRPSCIH